MIYIFRHALLKTYLCISLIVLIFFLCLEEIFFQEKWIKKIQIIFSRRCSSILSYFRPVYYHFLEPSLYTLKQRRWRASGKDKPYSAQLPLPISHVEQIANNLF